ncbi:MAG: nucleotidyltransferase family protein [Candidatus Caldarchaeum sp.]|nr:nucleotidyltransferase family protein [Candidatus Caldarchaeum sp.]MCS7138189.1 nucleotidyltransferase family protein [Candidatus Caldarchaeum sp.]MDW7977301.1 nucleotidyltransferase family protein [Candidatus Caldarchaeum sp.]MDW8360049.1 nucleotidyltransferase family protein [Candidatus Caldarchaeum sp.]
MKPVVLCGGEGSRLRPLTYYFQKTMVPVGREQRPLLEYILRHIRLHGFEEALLLVGYKGEQVANYFEDGSRVGLRLSYVWDSEDVKGTCSSLINALKHGAIHHNDSLLVYYGDILTNLDLRALAQKHQAEKAAATLALAPRYQLPVGVAEVRDSRVVSMREKPFIDINVTIGLLALEARTLKLAERSVDIMSDLIPFLIEKGEKVAAYVSEAFWYDVGSTEKYEKLTNEMVDSYLASLRSR